MLKVVFVILSTLGNQVSQEPKNNIDNNLQSTNIITIIFKQKEIALPQLVLVYDDIVKLVKIYPELES